MRKTENYHPTAVFFYFFAVIALTMFAQNPVVSALSLTGAVAYFSILRINHALRTHLFSLLLFLIFTLINPLFSKSGETVLFFFNNRPVTMEALFYGMTAAGSLVAALYWFFCFSHVMTSDKLMVVFSHFSKKLSLILTVSLRFIPLFLHQYRRIVDAQRAIGLFKDGNIVDSIKGRLRVLDILITWAIEGGIITAESMEARGYGTARRTFYSRCRFKASDAVFMLISLSLAAFSAIAVFKADFVFYPALTYQPSRFVTIGCIACSALSFLPIFNELQEALRWHYLQSRI